MCILNVFSHRWCHRRVHAAETEVIASKRKSYYSDDQWDGLQLSCSWQGPNPRAQPSATLPVWQGWLTLGVLSPPQIRLLRPLTNTVSTVLLCEMSTALPGTGQLWRENKYLHCLWGCSSATRKCCHVMKGKAVGHLQSLISIQQMLHNTPASTPAHSCNTPAQQLLFTSLSRLLHYLSLQLSVLLIYPSAQDQLFSICQLSFPSCTFPMYFSLALSLIAFLLHVSLHITLLLFLPLPCVTLSYLAFTLPYPCFTLPLFHLGLSNIQADLIPFQPHPTASWNPAWAMRRV